VERLWATTPWLTGHSERVARHRLHLPISDVNGSILDGFEPKLSVAVNQELGAVVLHYGVREDSYGKKLPLRNSATDYRDKLTTRLAGVSIL
jgi:hypothetical protein